MIRNLKVLAMAAMALSVVGAFGASGAQAAEEGKFHCSVAPCSLTVKTDGTGKTAHHVFIVNNGTGISASLTCEDLTGSATSATKTTKEITLEKIAYDGCTLFGSPVTVDMMGCDYLFTDSGEIHIKCPIGSGPITIIAGGACVVEIGPQTVNKVLFHDAATPPTKKEVTVETAVKGVLAHVTDDKCVPLGLPKGTYASSEYTTGNTIVHSTGNSVWYE